MAMSRGGGLKGWRRASLVGIKTVHTLAFFSIGSCLVYFAYSSLAKRSDRRRLGSEHGSVADIYLPHWIEDHLPFITGPIFAGAVMLHARNILRSRRERSPEGPPSCGQESSTLARAPSTRSTDRHEERTADLRAEAPPSVR